MLFAWPSAASMWRGPHARADARGLEQAHVVRVALGGLDVAVHDDARRCQHAIHLEAPQLAVVARTQRRAFGQTVAPELEIEGLGDALDQTRPCGVDARIEP